MSETDILIFVSYATKDAELFKISQLANELEAYDEIKNVLYWQEDMHDDIIEYMNDNLGKCNIILLFCTENALNSIPVKKEWMAAEQMSKPIIPVFLNEEYIPPILRSRLGLKFNQSDFQSNVRTLYDLILKKNQSYQELEIPSKEAFEKKIPFRSKMIKKSDVDKIKELQKEIQMPIENIEVNEDGFVTYIDFSLKKLNTIPTSMKTFSYLMSVEFSGDSFDSDDELKACMLDGLDVKIDGIPYEVGQIEARKKRITDEKARKEAEEIERKIEEKRLRAENQNLLDQAQKYLEAEQWSEALPLLQRSRGIYVRLNNMGGVKKVEGMISEAKAKKKKKDEDSLLGNLKILLQEKIHASPETLSKELDMSVNIIRPVLKSFAFWDKNSKEFWINKEEYDKVPADKRLVSFRGGAKIPQSQSDILEKLEKLLGKRFSLVSKTQYSTSMGYTVENNSVVGIYLYNCGLKTLPDGMQNFTSLKELNMQSNQFSTLPESIFTLESLVSLNLRDNQIISLPGSIGNLKSLNYLDVSNNQLTALPESIGNLKSLQALIVNNNKLTSLPESIGNLVSLQTLTLTTNQLKNLPESMINLTSLIDLYISSNPLKQDDEVLEKLHLKPQINIRY